MFGTVRLTKNADLDKYSYSGFGIGFDSHWLFLFPGFDWGRNVIFGVDNISSKHTDDKKIYLSSWWRTKQGLDDTTITNSRG